MAEKIVSPGVFTKEIDQTFLPSDIHNSSFSGIKTTPKNGFFLKFKAKCIA